MKMMLRAQLAETAEDAPTEEESSMKTFAKDPLIAALERKCERYHEEVERLMDRVKKLEDIIGRIQSNRGDETEVDALCNEGLGKEDE
jgi:predicted RNase H-like nuclease (RuvC/YqgF family)